MNLQTFFPGFEQRILETNHTELYVVTGGDGPPLYLLHGFPQTHVAWHKVAVGLANHFSLVIPDLRGYGNSAAPSTDEQHSPYSKREMAKDIIGLADHFGHERFAIAGHDRGARVAYRLILDNPGRVTRFCSVDVIPTLDVWDEMNADSARSQYHWSFLSTPAPVPETLIGNDPNFYFRHLFKRWASDINKLDKKALQAYLDQYHKPELIHAQCEDYRAGATLDHTHDLADREAGKKLDCPVLFLLGRSYLGDKAVSPKATWEKWADDVTEIAFDCGHFVVEEEPQAAFEALLSFFSAE